MSRILLTTDDIIKSNIYVKLKKDFRYMIFNKARMSAGSIRTLSKMSHINLRMLCYYKSGGRSIPISRLYKILPLISEKLIYKDLENNLLQIRCGKSGKSIYNPRLPLKLSDSLIRITAHVIGDGGISKRHGNKTVTYSNKANELLEQFKKDIQQVFGEIEPTSINDKKSKCIELFYPSIIGFLLNKIIGIQSSADKHVPSLVLKCSERSRRIFLGALFDDEGNVNMEAYKINFEIASYNIIRDVKFMLERLSIKTSNIVRVDRRENDRPRYKITVNGRQNIVRYGKMIGFSSKEKSEKLNALMNFYKIPHRNKIEVKRAIINVLKGHDMSFYELATELQNQNIGAFRYSLRKLVQLGLVSFDIQHFGKGVRRVYKLK